VAAAVSSTAGQAPMTSPRAWERAKASNPARVSQTVVRTPSRRSHTAMQATPKPARTTPPSGRDPVALATANPRMSPAAASTAVEVRRITLSMLASADIVPGMDEGLPIAYQLLEDGVPVYAADGTAVGTVDHVVAAAAEDIFHGVVIHTDAGRRFVAADQVASLHEHGVDLRIAAEEVAGLPAPHGGAPELEVKDPTVKTHRWKEVLDMVRGKGSLGADWQDED
jgi:hypothetical protein